MKNYYQKEIETASREEIIKIQNEKLVKQVKHVYDNVPYYRDLMDKKGVKPEDIKTIDDIKKLPFLTKDDLREAYPYGLLGTDLKNCVRIQSTSGTTGKRVVAFYTQKDVDMWEECCARAIVAAGGTNEDVVQVSYGYGLFTGGLGAHSGFEKIGATVIPASGGNTERQVMLMKDFGVTCVACTPSYFLHMIETAEKMGVDMRELPVRLGIFGAEPWTEAMRAQIEKKAGIRAYDIYGLSEIVGPGVGCSCPEQDGLHIFEDFFYPEIIDPATGEVLPDGQEGELVLTTLAKHAMPMIRYRTRDITSIMTSKCACGRTIRRISKIGRRSDDMFIIRGVNVFPSQIETAIMSVESVMPVYQIILTREHGLDNIEVDIEVNETIFHDRVSAIEDIRHTISHAIERILGIRVFVKMCAPNSIPRSEGKAKRVIDRRNLNS